MANLKISEFVDGGAIQDTDSVAAVRAGVNTKVTVGSAAALDAGTGVGDVLLIADDGDGNPQYPPIDGSLITGLNINPSANLLINGDFRVAQRGTSFTSASVPANSDDTYLLDRWLLLSDGNDIVDVSQETSTVPTGSYAAIKLDIETANKKAGILQLVEARDAKRAIDGTVSLSFKARKGASNATVDKLRAAVVSWSGTADAPTSDIVSAWNAEGSNPTLIANWTYENTPADLTTLTTSFQTYKIENISVDTSSTANIGVFIWVDNDDGTVTDQVFITDVMLNTGANAVSYQARPFATEFALCKRYCFVKHGRQIKGVVNSATTIMLHLDFETEMRTAPSATLLNTAFNVNFNGGTGNTAGSGSTITGTNASAQSARLLIDGFSGLTQGQFAITNHTSNLVTFDAEL